MPSYDPSWHQIMGQWLPYCPHNQNNLQVAECFFLLWSQPLSCDKIRTGMETFKLKRTLSLLIVICPTLASSSSPTAVSTPTPAYTIMIQKQARGNPAPPPTLLVTAHHNQSPCNLYECAFGSVCLFKMDVLYHMCGSLSFLSVRHWPDVTCLVVDWGYNADEPSGKLIDSHAVMSVPYNLFWYPPCTQFCLYG